MTLKVQALDGVKVYNITSGKSIPEWLKEKKSQKALKKDAEFQSRVELLQDFEMPNAASKIKCTQDGQFIFVSGYHPPLIKVFDTQQLSEKFERNFDAEIVDFQILTEDYSKVAFLCFDRTIYFHARFGYYHKTRIPKFGRSLAYMPDRADLVCVGASPDVYRLNLSQGIFMEPVRTRAPANNVCGVSPQTLILGCGGEEGGFELFDFRQKDSISWIDVSQQMNQDFDLTALRFDSQGMHIAVGTSNGQVVLYDLRKSTPLFIKDHMYDSKIIDIKFHEKNNYQSQNRLITTDKHIVKIWDQSSGETVTNIQLESGYINDTCVFPDSGLIAIATENPKIQAFFIPSLGPAPAWCSFVEALTEEAEQSKEHQMVYDDYRFVTQPELEVLGLKNLVGTPLLRAYMHGYFMDQRLYRKAKRLKDEGMVDVQKEKLRKQLDKQEQSRIGVVQKIPKVNVKIAERLMEELKKAPIDQDQSIQSKAQRPNLLHDDRFKALFEDKQFQIDEESDAYKLLHPTLSTHKKVDNNRGSSGLQAQIVMDNNIQSRYINDDKEQGSDESSELDSDTDIYKDKQISRLKDQPTMFIPQSEEAVNNLLSGSRYNQHKQTLAQRLQSNESNNKHSNSKQKEFGGNRQQQFKVQKRSKQNNTNNKSSNVQQSNFKQGKGKGGQYGAKRSKPQTFGVGEKPKQNKSDKFKKGQKFKR